jgi:hypothetical protein
LAFCGEGERFRDYGGAVFSVPVANIKRFRDGLSVSSKLKVEVVPEDNTVPKLLGFEIGICGDIDQRTRVYGRGLYV